MATCALTGHSASGAKNDKNRPTSDSDDLSTARLSSADGGGSVCFHIYLVSVSDETRWLAANIAKLPDFLSCSCERVGSFR